MDFHHKEILKRYARMATGRPFAPILLNILITSVCDMRCVHCFFTDELNDKSRKKLQMTTSQVGRISETLGANLGVLIIAVLEAGLAQVGATEPTKRIITGCVIVAAVVLEVGQARRGDR